MAEPEATPQTHRLRPWGFPTVSPSHPSLFPHHGIQQITVEFSEESPLFRVFQWIPWLLSDPSGAAIGCCWTESAVGICADLGCRGNRFRPATRTGTTHRNLVFLV